jgi:hypothetical protein
MKDLGRNCVQNPFGCFLWERKKIRWADLGLVKKEKQLDERKLCSFFAKPQKQICPLYFSSKTLIVNGVFGGILSIKMK